MVATAPTCLRQGRCRKSVPQHKIGMCKDQAADSTPLTHLQAMHLHHHAQAVLLLIYQLAHTAQVQKRSTAEHSTAQDSDGERRSLLGSAGMLDV